MSTGADISVLGVAGSPRLKATHYAVNEALEYAAAKHGVAVDYFSLHGKDIGFCRHCDHCVRKRQGCIIDDDMGDLYPKLLAADAWILATPVYQGQVSGQLKAAMDRCRALVAADAHAFRDKVGAGLCVGGDRNGGQEPALLSLLGFFVINEMVPVGGGSFGANLGAALWSQDRGAAGVKADAEGLAASHRVVDRLVRMARLLRRARSVENAE
ncbi:MAG TPA: flavodoxin family protein [Thermoleophilia bacterium]|nr:flavodoxin family protein [Thermoleophilia bacterium]HQG03811.1 flavodoxin family protein [Thermoleophilia bacterium]HQG53950.1 flavodoxin family protein [Thermoleophilia bacterium]HQJ97152.1 flavodoxin family protein [Thermoleophilia bacterium]